ncbi:MAG TPA: hypothetical protein VGS79_23975 [Puia sp.]|nr:hypothetical protein [Puia sp.]
MAPIPLVLIDVLHKSYNPELNAKVWELSHKAAASVGYAILLLIIIAVGIFFLYQYRKTIPPCSHPTPPTAPPRPAIPWQNNATGPRRHSGSGHQLAPCRADIKKAMQMCIAVSMQS